ncbi:retrovirus-related pol polyprotein from transposon TNT 1-94 [Tanacetum coccineum]|uniref:Retrovirus-related pol polyprotein from transposon TNT 1-94 n=1 Tax=Tanacetum coccineum TaxID=301880 RepID=A0ABQ5E6C3_9ASTR
MTTLAEHIIVDGAENHPPMLEKSMYDSWASRIRLFIKGKKHGRMMLDSIDNGPLVYPTVEENGQTRPKKYLELTKAQQLQDDCDVQATNIILHGLPPNVVKYLTQHSQADFPQLDSGLAVLIFQQGEDPIECINKAMAFLYAVASRFPPSNNQLRTSSNPKNQTTIQDGRVTVQQVQGRQSQSFAGIGNRGIATTSRGNYAVGQPRVVKCYNCQREGHMARQSEAQEAGQILDEEQLTFLADLGISEAPVAQQTIPQNSAFQTEDLDAYDSDCDDLSLAKAVLMANLSSCDSDVLSEVPYTDFSLNDMINQDVQEMQYSKQTHIDDFLDNEIHSDSNIIPYSQYLQESQDAIIQDTNSF